MFDYHWKRMGELNKNEKQYLYAVVKFSLVWFGFMVFNATFNDISVIFVAVSFIGGGDRRKPQTCRKSLANFIT